MSDIHELQASVRAAMERERSSPAAELGRDSLMRAFNAIAPEQFRVGTSGVSTLAVRASGRRRPTTAHDTAFVIEHFSRAVASIGREIREPNREYVPLRRPDYLKAPVFVSTSPAGLILIQPERPEPVFDDLHPSISETALERLTELLPSDASDDRTIGRLLGARTPSRRALRDVAAVSKRLSGLELTLTSRAGESRASVTVDQAEEIETALNVDETSTEFLYRTGIMDGARQSRRKFYFQPDKGPAIEGVIDERMVEDVFRNLRQQVNVTIEKSQTRTKAGAAGRPGFRLVNVSPIEPIPDLA